MCVMVFVANSALSAGCDECVWICYTVGTKINFAFRFTYRRIRNVRTDRSVLVFFPSVRPVPFRSIPQKQTVLINTNTIILRTCVSFFVYQSSAIYSGETCDGAPKV